MPVVLISHASKVMLKIFQARLHQYMNRELPDVPAVFRKGRGTSDQIANICWIFKKESSRKTSTFALLTMPKPLTVWITTNCGKFFKTWDTRLPDLPPEKSVCRNLTAEATVSTGHGTRDCSHQETSTSRLCIVTLLI